MKRLALLFLLFTLAASPAFAQWSCIWCASNPLANSIMLATTGGQWVTTSLAACTAPNTFLTYESATHTFACAAGGGGTPAAPPTSIQYNNAGAFGGDAGLTFAGGAVNIGKTGVGGELDITDTNNKIVADLVGDPADGLLELGDGTTTKISGHGATGTLAATIITDKSADPADSGFIRMGNAVNIAWEKAVAGTDWTLGVTAGDVLTSSAAFESSVSVKAPFFVDGSADPADSGAVRLGNNVNIAWEKATTGTDWTLGVNASDVLSTNAAFNSDVSLTAPFLYFGADPADAGRIRLSNGDSISWERNPAGTDISWTANSGNELTTTAPISIFSDTSYLAIGATDTADAGAIRLQNGACIESEASPAGTDMSLCSDTSERWVSNSTIRVAPGADGWEIGQHMIPFQNGSSDLGDGTHGVRILWLGTAGGVVFGNNNDVVMSRQAQGQIKFRNVTATVGDDMTWYTGIKTLTNDSATIFNKVTMTSGSQFGGIIRYSVEDTTTPGVITGEVPIAAVDTAGTITCSIKASDSDGQSIGGSAGFALNSGFTCADAGSNVLNLSMQAKTTGGTDTLRIRYTILQNGTLTMVGQ